MSLREAINNASLADRLIFIALLVISLTGMVFVKEILPHSDDVSIEVEGKVKYMYPLSDNRLVKVNVRNGHLTVEIKDKKVRVIDASCPNKLCERQGWIDAGAIICLPNRVSVIVGGREESKGRKLDAITG